MSMNVNAHTSATTNMEMNNAGDECKEWTQSYQEKPTLDIVVGEELDTETDPLQRLGLDASHTGSHGSSMASSSFEDGSSDTSLFSGHEDEEDDSEDGMTVEIIQSILSAIQEEPSLELASSSKPYYS